ncbi:MAG TPA: hypothetical protein VMV92_08130 [Streptosporangiaceae bacterium]|nr:hypothetical protein [Streptosporangiaceae bacterium]
MSVGWAARTGAAVRLAAATPHAVAAVVAGFPTRNEVSTVRHVADVVEEGLRRAGLAGCAVLVNADNGSSDGTPAAFCAAPGGIRRLSISTGAEGTGKGTNVLAIFRAALDMGAARVAVFDADVRSAEPGWAGAMLGAVDGDAPAMAVPVYRRNRYEGNTTSHLVSPLLAAVLGVHVQQPIAGDFAFNRSFVEHALTWPLPESARLYGIDIHLTGSAAREGYRIVQVPLGRKIHNPGFPKILFMSQQVIDSAFHVIARTGHPRLAPAAPPGERATVDAAAVRPDARLVERTLAKVRAYLAQHRAAIRSLFPSLDHGVQVRGGLAVLDAPAWGEVLADALAAVAAGRAAGRAGHCGRRPPCNIAGPRRACCHRRF